MDEVIAAIDDSAAARPVLLAARELARLFGDVAVAVHVRNGDDRDGRTATELAAAAGVPLRMLDGVPRDAIAEAAAGAGVRAVVVGARRLPAGRRPVGHVALALIETLAKPVMVVPPSAVIRTDAAHRVLIPLEGTGETSAAIDALFTRLRPDTGLEVVALHVFEPEDAPAFSDQPVYETEAWSHEFAQRWVPPGVHDVALEMRVGRAADVVPAVVADVDADVVAVGWHQDLSPGRAEVVATLLAHAVVPVVLVPLVRSPLVRR